MKRVLAAVVVIITIIADTIVGHAQPDPEVEWMRGYEVPYHAGIRCHALCQISDGGFAFAGVYSRGGPPWQQGYILRTNVVGDTLWSWTSSYAEGMAFGGVIETPDHGFVLSGYLVGSLWRLFMLLKIDSIGHANYSWIHTFGWGVANSVCACRDGGFAVCGQRLDVYGDGSADGLLIKTDSAGGQLWTRSYAEELSNNVEFKLIEQTADGGFLLAGNAGLQFLVVKTDSDGVSQWMRTFGGEGEEIAYSASPLGDGGYIIAGTTRSWGMGYTDYWLLRLNANGDSLWSRAYGTATSDELRAMAVARDGGFMLAGATDYGAGQAQVWLLRASANGDSLWSNTFGYSTDNMAYALSRLADGSYLLGGGSYPCSSISEQMLVIKTGPDRPAPSLRLTQPSGGQEWRVMTTDTIRWCSVALLSDVALDMDRSYPNGQWTTLLPSTPNDGEESIQVTGPASTSCRIRARAVDDPLIFDISDADFSIMCPTTELPFVDNFDSPTLDSCWYWLNEDTTYWSITSRPGWLTIYTQYCAPGELRNALLRRVTAPRLRVQTKLVFAPGGDEQYAGIICYVPSHYPLRVWRCQNANVNRVTFQADEGSGTNWNVPCSQDTVWFRLDVLDHLTAAWYSVDSLNWNSMGYCITNWVPSENMAVGLTTNGTSQIHTPADFDYFRVDSLPGTTVCGNVSGVWDSTGSPYYVTCDVTVPAGQTLEIRPGVQVLFTGHYKFNVFGNLQAIGTEQDSIVFTRAFPTEESRSAGIKVLSTGSDTNRFEYCTIRYGKATAGGDNGNHGGAIACWGNTPIVVTNCTLDSNYAADDGGAILANGSSYVRISDCLISSDSSGISGTGPNGIVELAVSGASIDHCLVHNNHISNGGGAVTVLSGAVAVTRCTFVGNSSIGSNSVLYVNGGAASFRSSIAWNNTGVPLSSSTVCAYSDVQGGYPGTGNIDANPMFVDTANGDFHLQANSPCVDTGDPSSPLDPDATRADMGAYPYFYPCLMIDPDSLDYGLLDLGTDSTLELVLRNRTNVPIPVTDVFCTLPAFSFDTTGLGGHVPPFTAYNLTVTFAPSSPGACTDTLVVAVQQQCDTLIRIPLHGEADVLLPPVDSLVIQRGPMNGIQLDWAPVTHSISGQPVQNVSYAIYGSTSCRGPFVPFGYSTTNSYIHPNILNGQPMYFYQVAADVGSSRGQTKQR